MLAADNYDNNEDDRETNDLALQATAHGGDCDVFSFSFTTPQVFPGMCRSGISYIAVEVLSELLTLV